MSTFFAFTDESGLYKQNRDRGNSFLSVHPFYLRACLIINSNDWQLINLKLAHLKRKYRIPLKEEVKWSYLSAINSNHKNQKTISEKKPYKFLERHTYQELQEFIKESLEILKVLDSAKIVITITNNSIFNKYKEEKILRWHFEDLLQRIEMEMSPKNNVCVIFCDTLQEKDKLLKNVFHDLCNGSRFIKEYHHVKNSLSIEYSHQSAGIQIVDFIAGITTHILRYGKKQDWYQEIFDDYVLPFVRKKANGDMGGYGIIEIPKDPKVRTTILKTIQIPLLSQVCNL